MLKSDMKIYWVRHGEAMDDVRNEYGGWHNPELAEAGIESAKRTAESLKSKSLKVQKVLSSPLKRAQETAKIIADVLGLEMETEVFLKERNTYGLLCGVNKDEAKLKYPELVEAYEKGEEVLGYEEYGLFLRRVKRLISRLKTRNEDVICVTHGKLLGAVFKDIIGKEAKKIDESCMVETEMDEGGIRLIGSEGVEFD